MGPRTIVRWAWFPTIAVALAACAQGAQPDPSPLPELSSSATAESPGMALSPETLQVATPTPETTATQDDNSPSTAEAVSSIIAPSQRRGGHLGRWSTVDPATATEEELRALYTKDADWTVLTGENCTVPPSEVHVITGVRPDLPEVLEAFGTNVVARRVVDVSSARIDTCRETRSGSPDRNTRLAPLDPGDSVPGLLVEEIPWKTKS